jgi:hypothetical protein
MVALLAAAAFGVVMSLIKGSGGGARLQFGNLSAPWLLVAFVAGSRYCRLGAAAAAGVLATMAALIGFYGDQIPLTDFSPASIVAPHGVVFAGAVITGLLFGALGFAWAARGSQLALGVLALMFVAEPVAQLGSGEVIGSRDPIATYWWLWLAEIALGIALLAATWHAAPPRR